MKKMNLIFAFLCLSHWCLAQTEESVMEGSGKIYVVLATVLAMFVGVIVFLTIIDRKLSNLERQIKE